MLIVDDNRDVADSTAVLLRAAGCNVDLAYDGEEALRSIRALRPDAVLLDIGLPKIDGYQVAEHIRAEGAARVRSSRYRATVRTSTARDPGRQGSITTSSSRSNWRR